MKSEFLEYINTFLLTGFIFFITRHFKKSDLVSEKVDNIEDRVLVLETEKRTETKIKKEIKGSYEN